MQGWAWTLVLKPLAVVAVVFAYYVVVYKGSHLIGRLLPNGRLKEFLFRERGSESASGSASPAERRLK